jgi:hypothetical protein
MLFPELANRLSRLLRIDRSRLLTDEVREIEPRLLSELEAGWIQSMLDASFGWETADISKTQVVAEGPRAEGISFTLQAPVPENPNMKAVRNSFANLWIYTSDQVIINAQLSEWEGRLQELYVLIIDSKHPKRIIRTLPEGWMEVSREAVGFGS